MPTAPAGSLENYLKSYFWCESKQADYFLQSSGLRTDASRIKTKLYYGLHVSVHRLYGLKTDRLNAGLCLPHTAIL